MFINEVSGGPGRKDNRDVNGNSSQTVFLTSAKAYLHKESPRGQRDPDTPEVTYFITLESFRTMSKKGLNNYSLTNALTTVINK